MTRRDIATMRSVGSTALARERSLGRRSLRSGFLRMTRVWVLLGPLACSRGAKDADEPAKHPSVGATTIVIVAQGFTETLGAIGTVVSRAGHVATRSAPAAGHVAQIFVTTGQRVSQGETLVEMDRAPFEAALASAEATLSAAEKANERQVRLEKDGIVPRKDVEQSTADLAKARSDVIAARRVVQLATLKSPIAGVVTRMSATLGASVDPAQPLVEVSDPTALDILMSVTPTEAARVRPGVKVGLSAGQSLNGETLGIGTVVDVSGTVDSTSRSVAVRVRAPTTRRPLRIGETVYGEIAVETKGSAVVVPLEALVPNGDEYKVFVVDPNGVAHERDVKIGGKTATSAEVVDGLKVGDKIVTYGAYGMQDSARVVPLKPADTTAAAEKPADSDKADKADKSDKADKAAPAKPAKP
jgi:membrane fusion protein (multidrug efflux system)